MTARQIKMMDQLVAAPPGTFSDCAVELIEYINSNYRGSPLSEWEEGVLLGCFDELRSITR